MAKKMTFSATGDSLMVTRFPKGYDAGPVANFIKSAQARLTNLEAVVSDFDCFPSSYSGGTWVNATPDVLPDLLSYGFNLFSCANNHSMDYSYDGLISTMKHLNERGLKFAGIGKDLNEASRATVIDLPMGRVAMISICSSFNDAARAGYPGDVILGRPGLNPLRSKTVYTVTPEHIKALKEIAASTKINGEKDNSKKMGFSPKEPEGYFEFGNTMFREGEVEGKMSYCNKSDLLRTKNTIEETLEIADYVVVMAHSHEIKGEHYHEPDYFFEEFCRACIDYGACAVIGSGTHQLKPVEIYKGKPIFYSLGDFIFQNGSVKYLPPDFMEKYGLPPTATTEEGYRARSKNGTVGLHTDKANYLSVIPYFEAEGDKITKVVLMPIELGFDLEDAYKGFPYAADTKTAAEIYEHLCHISCGYNTAMHLEGNLIKVEI